MTVTLLFLGAVEKKHTTCSDQNAQILRSVSVKAWYAAGKHNNWCHANVAL